MTQAAQRPQADATIPQRRESGAIASTWREFWTMPFRALRAIYWMLDQDAMVRSKGTQVMGRVTKTGSTTRTYQGEGGEETITTYHVDYQFVAGGRTLSAQKKVGSLAGLKEGASINVYYMSGPDPIKSAIDSKW